MTWPSVIPRIPWLEALAPTEHAPSPRRSRLLIHPGSLIEFEYKPPCELTVCLLSPHSQPGLLCSSSSESLAALSLLRTHPTDLPISLTAPACFRVCFRPAPPTASPTPTRLPPRLMLTLRLLTLTSRDVRVCSSHPSTTYLDILILSTTLREPTPLTYPTTTRIFLTIRRAARYVMGKAYVRFQAQSRR